MLVLSRKLNESITINGNIVVTFVANKGNVIRLGIEAPREVNIRRTEVPAHVFEDAPIPITPPATSEAFRKAG